MPTLAVAQQRSDATGLTSAEAARTLERDGPNVLPIGKGPSPWRHLARQFVHLFALMLWVAGLLAFVGRLPELGIAIFAVILFNAVFAFAQEFRAERAAEALRDLLPRRVIVLRDGARRDVDAAELVKGDVVILSPGDRISADLRAEETHALRVDTSLLTGESETIVATRGDTLPAGSFVTQGEGQAVVVATGRATRLAQIAQATQATSRPAPPLALDLRRVVRTIAVIAVGLGVMFFSVSLSLGTRAVESFVFAIGVTVALVPEALLPTVTLSLAIGAQRMAAQHALVKRLEAVETLGSTTFICTDKTGTLTQNEMSVVQVWTSAGTTQIEGRGYEPVGRVDVQSNEGRAEIASLAACARTCVDARAVLENGRWVPLGDPMEVAMAVFAERAGVTGSKPPQTTRFPFDQRRRSSVMSDGAIEVMGAPDTVLPLCEADPHAETALHHMTTRGLRVIALATRPWPSSDPPRDSAEAERELTLLGLLGLEDPPRHDAASSLQACRTAGIKVAMLTGDHPATATAIAREVGLASDPPVVLLGDELPSDEEVLGALVDRDGVVIARVSPEQKLRIAKALRRRGHVLAMTGDGVNDGPALQAADIGVAMGRSGTDVAREAADLVLLDDNFATIVGAIEQGRAIFANVRRFLTYHLTDNVAELTPFLVWALSGGRFPLALGVLQILALDIGTDTLSAVALGAESPGKHVLLEPPARGRLLDREVGRRSFALMGPVEALCGMVAFLVTLLAAGWRPGSPFPEGDVLLAASGATFATVVIAQTANAFACRSTTTTPWAMGWSTNRLLVGGAAVELGLAGTFLFVPPIADLLGHASPALAGWLVALASFPVVLSVDAFYKSFRPSEPRGTPSRLRKT